MRYYLPICLLFLSAPVANGVLQATPDTCFVFHAKSFSVGISNKGLTYDVQCPDNIRTIYNETQSLQPVGNGSSYFATSDYVQGTKSVLLLRVDKPTLDKNPDIALGDETGYPVNECGLCDANVYSNGWGIFNCYKLEGTACPAALQLTEDIRYNPPPPAVLTSDVVFEYCYYAGGGKYICGSLVSFGLRVSSAHRLGNLLTSWLTVVMVTVPVLLLQNA